MKERSFLENNSFVKFFKENKISTWVIFLFLVYIVLAIKVVTFKNLEENIIFGIYSILVSVYILSRFGLSYFYEFDEADFDKNYKPTISFAVPSKNE